MEGDGTPRETDGFGKGRAQGRMQEPNGGAFVHVRLPPCWFCWQRCGGEPFSAEGRWGRGCRWQASGLAPTLLGGGTWSLVPPPESKGLWNWVSAVRGCRRHHGFKPKGMRYFVPSTILAPFEQVPRQHGLDTAIDRNKANMPGQVHSWVSQWQLLPTTQTHYSSKPVASASRSSSVSGSC